MRYLIQTLLATSNSGEMLKYEIYSDNRKVDYSDKIPEGSCKVIVYKLVGDAIQLSSDVDLQALFDANRPAHNTFYSDGPHRVSLEMLIDFLNK